MPRVERLSKRLVGSADGPLTMAPVTMGEATQAVNPHGPWRQFPKTRGGKVFVFLAYVSYPYPATVQADGVAKPVLDHLLTWLVLSVDTAGFDAAGGGPVPGTNAVSSKCMPGTSTSGSLGIWNAATGVEIESTGFTVTSPKSMQQALKLPPRAEFSTKSFH
jgi:hypothetical protein